MRRDFADGSGRMLGGNSAFAHVGSYEEIDGVIVGRVAGQRHADNSEVRQLYGADDDELILRGRAVGSSYHFDASPVRLSEPIDGEHEQHLRSELANTLKKVRGDPLWPSASEQ